MILATVVQADPLGLLVAFGAGMLSFVSPCVLPLVPGYVSMVSGLSAVELEAIRPSRPGPAGVAVDGRVPVGVRAGGAEGEVAALGAPPGGRVAPAPEETAVTAVAAVAAAPGASGVRAVPPAPVDARARLLRGILLFIAGFTVVFTMLGASASSVGHLLATHRPALDTVSGLLIVAFGSFLVLMAAGVRLPATLTGEHRIAVRPSVLGAWAPPIMGVAFAFAWTPCIGPVLASVLALAAGTGGTTTGGIALLLAYSLGLGVPFLLFGLAFGRMTDLIARFRGKLRLVDLVGGAVLVAFGVLLLTGNVDVLSAHISAWLRDLGLGRLSTS